jgi:DNA-binding response OmpR family regulator
LPIIAQTAFYDEDGREVALKAGCDDYITKPIQQTDLVIIINQLLKKNKG